MGGLSALNLRFGAVLPWAILPMTLYLGVYWGFISGRLGDPISATSRRVNLRANRLPVGMWSASLAAGALGFAALLALLAVAARLVPLPSSPPIVMPPEMPFMTAFLLIIMQSIVAGATEEAAFRGYMQGPIERRYGVIAAILVNGTFFGLLHFGSHPSDVLLMLPYYIAVAAVYGGLTWAADSILPALVLQSHSRSWTGIPLPSEMNRAYPYTIDNGQGELLTFTGLTQGPNGERLEADDVAQPGAGPPSTCTTFRKRPRAWFADASDIKCSEASHSSRVRVISSSGRQVLRTVVERG